MKIYINREKKEVYAIITGCENDAHKFFLDKVGDRLINFNPKAMMNDTYKATAKCFKGDDTYPADVWDEAVGIELAKHRVTEKYTKAFNAAVAVIEQDLKDSLSQLVEVHTIRKLQSKAHMIAQKEYIAQLL